VVEQDKRGVGRSDDLDNLIEFALAYKDGGIGLLAALDEGCGNSRAGRPGELLELGAAGVEVEGGGRMVGEVFVACRDRSRGTGQSSGCGKLLALAHLAGELDHDNYGKFLLRLRGAEFAGKQRRILGLTRFDETASDCLSAVPA